MLNPNSANAFGIRSKLIALLLVAIVPMAALLVHSTAKRYQLLIEASTQQAQALAIALADRNGAIVDNTQSILHTLANDPSVQHGQWRACDDALKSFHSFFRNQYSIFHVATRNGEVRCSSVPLKGKVNVGDRPDFKEALASGEFVMGSLVESRTTGLPSIVARYPVRGPGGHVIAVVTAQLAKLQFEVATLSTPLPENGELLILNNDREIILRLPTTHAEAVDVKLTAPSTLNIPALQAELLKKASGTVEATGEDGIRRIYGYSRVPISDNSWLYAVMGLDTEKIRTQVLNDLLRSSSATLLVAIVVFSLAWLGVNRLILQKVEVLVDTVTRLRNGEASARTGIAHDRDELCRIAAAIDETAEELEQAMNTLREQTVRDPLTNLYNRRYMEETVMRELQTAKRRGWQLGVIMCDIDHFKRFNDTYGHELGDQVLKAVSTVMMANVRGGDTVCRFGGEEFAIILPGAPIDIAAGRAEAIRQAISEVRLSYADTDVGTITLSFGVAVFPAMGKDVNELIRHADEALYQAKHNGRNQVMLATHAMHELAR